MSGLSGPIPGLLDGRGRREDRRATRLTTAWLLRRQSDALPSSPWLTRDERTSIDLRVAPPRRGRGAVLVILSDQVPATSTAISEAIRGEGRVYVLAPSGWASEQTPGWLARAPTTRVLLRRVRQAPIAAVLTDDRGWLWFGPDGPGAWRLTLDQEQVEAARQVFRDLYWNDADDEGWPEGGKVSWRARGPSPFQIARQDDGSAIRLARAASERPSPSGAATRWYAPDGELPDPMTGQVTEQLWVPASGAGHDALARRARDGVDVVWSDLGLPLCWTGARAGAVARTERWSLEIQLNPDQGAALDAVMTRTPDARFASDLPLSRAERELGPEGRLWLPDQSEPRALVTEQSLDAGVVAADSLRGAAACEPTSWPEPSPLALSARWRWRVAPPATPEGAKDDPLVDDWRAADRRFDERASALRGSLAELESHESALQSAFEGLRSALLGFGRSRSGLQRRLAALGAEVLSEKGPDGAREHLAGLAEVADEVTELTGRVADAEREEQETIERTRQEEQHTRAREEAEQDLVVHEQGLAEAEKTRDEVEIELGSLASSSDAKLSKKERKDRKAKRKQLGDQRTRLEGEVKLLEGRIAEARATIARPFEYRPGKAKKKKHRRKGSLVPEPRKKAAIRVPGEALPAVGELLRAGEERVLAIRSWDDLDPGEREASRLNARLVADPEK